MKRSAADMKIIVDETLNIMLAGRDTVCQYSPLFDGRLILVFQTASLLTFTTYFLAMYPEVLSRLRQEVLSSVGSNRAPR